MEHLLTPFGPDINHSAWWDDGFTEEELDWLQGEARKADQTAHIRGPDTSFVDNSTRRSTVKWISSSENTRWIFKKLAHIVSDLNANVFRFDLTGFGEPLQLTNYDEANQGLYKWHQDFGNQNVSRKLSLVLQLSDPSEYEGGELQLLAKEEPIVVTKKRGLITVFPAWTLHQVTPVIRGSRQSLVAWVSGAPFR